MVCVAGESIVGEGDPGDEERRGSDGSSRGDVTEVFVLEAPAVEVKSLKVGMSDDGELEGEVYGHGEEAVEVEGVNVWKSSKTICEGIQGLVPVAFGLVQIGVRDADVDGSRKPKRAVGQRSGRRKGRIVAFLVVRLRAHLIAAITDEGSSVNRQS